MVGAANELSCSTQTLMILECLGSCNTTTALSKAMSGQSKDLAGCLTGIDQRCGGFDNGPGCECAPQPRKRAVTILLFSIRARVLVLIPMLIQAVRAWDEEG